MGRILRYKINKELVDSNIYNLELSPTAKLLLYYYNEAFGDDIIQVKEDDVCEILWLCVKSYRKYRNELIDKKFIEKL